MLRFSPSLPSHESVPVAANALPGTGASTASVTAVARVTYSATMSASFCGMENETTGLARFSSET